MLISCHVYLLLKLQVSSLLIHHCFILLSCGLSGGNAVTQGIKGKDETCTSKAWNTVENKRTFLQEPNGDIDMCVWKSKLSKV